MADGVSEAELKPLRDRLVEQLRGAGHIVSPLIEEAFRAVPRHFFLPGEASEDVYRDEAFPTKRASNGLPVSSSSQPAIMAVMLEQLGLERGQRVLEIGAGTGYNAALIAHAVGEGGAVATVDIDETWSRGLAPSSTPRASRRWRWPVRTERLATRCGLPTTASS